MSKNDVFNIISSRRNQLLARKRDITAEYRRQIAEIDNELGKLTKAVDTINRAIQPYICPVCNGRGYIRRPDAAGQMEDVCCDACNGTCIKSIEEK